MEKSDDKVRTEKMEEATNLLKEMMDVVQRYDRLFKILSKQEKYLAGGIVFRIRNTWADFSLVGIMVDRELAREMIDTLVLFWQNPARVTGIKLQPGIEVAEKGKPN